MGEIDYFWKSAYNHILKSKEIGDECRCWRLEMSFRIYAIIIIFALFIIIMIVNPRLSCFGRWIKSPLYPLLRKKKQKQIKTTDYGFKLTEGKPSDVSRKASSLYQKEPRPDLKKKNIKTQDYGFKLSEDNNDSDSGQGESGKNKS